MNREDGRDGMGRGEVDRPVDRAESSDRGGGLGGDRGYETGGGRERDEERRGGSAADRERGGKPYRPGDRAPGRRENVNSARANRPGQGYGDRGRPPYRKGNAEGRNGDRKGPRERATFRGRPGGRPEHDGGRAFGGRDRAKRFSGRDERGPSRAFSDRAGGGRGRHDKKQEGGRRERLPELAPDIKADELDREAREELRALPRDLADLVARHLVAAVRALSADDPERAYEHTKAARRFAARVGVVREASGFVAYRAGQYAEALNDLRAARRLTGSNAYLAVMADCERGLGRPERALDLIRSQDAERLDRAGRIELAIVESGARRDLGQYDAAVITLQRVPELRDPEPKPWSARLAFAYADALADAGHEAAAIDWFERAMAFDEEGETDAARRYAELTGIDIEDMEEDAEDGFGEEAAELLAGTGRGSDAGVAEGNAPGDRRDADARAADARGADAQGDGGSRAPEDRGGAESGETAEPDAAPEATGWSQPPAGA